MQSVQPILLNLDTDWRRFGWTTCTATVQKILFPIAGTILLHRNNEEHSTYMIIPKKIISTNFWFNLYNYNSWLHEVQVTVVADEVCDPILPSEICAGSMNIFEAPCLGDDGGPLVVGDPNVNNNGLTIAGIIHFNDCNSVETYTKVSMFRDWICCSTSFNNQTLIRSTITIISCNKI